MRNPARYIDGPLRFIRYDPLEGTVSLNVFSNGQMAQGFIRYDPLEGTARR